MAPANKSQVSTLDFVINSCSTDQQNGLEAEMKQNGQTYMDREEEDEHEQVKLVSSASKANGSCLLCGFAWGEVKWSNLVWLLFLHLLFGWAFVHACTSPVKVQSVVWTVFTSVFSGFGMSVGAHRLWAHRSFKAHPLLRAFLLLLQTMTINGSALSYARDHRNHHKWPATDADPKNPARGFFFAHIGWWMLRKKEDVAQFGQKVPIDDLIEEQMLVLQHRFYLPLVAVFALLMPILLPWLCWSEDPLTSAALCIIRVVVVLHHLFSVNSVAHFWGYRPYNRYQKPTENHIINWISMGEGQHNYHHAFPFDYCNSEYYWWQVFNPASLFIEVCMLIGLASEPKKPSPTLIQRVIDQKGKPEYFVDIHQRSLWIRIVLAVFDWTMGLLFAQWPLWLVIVYKAVTGQPMIVL